MAPPASDEAAPDHTTQGAPVCHHWPLLATIACQSTMKVAGRLSDSASSAAASSQRTSREPGLHCRQLKGVAPEPVGVPPMMPLFWLSVLSSYMLTNLR